MYEPHEGPGWLTYRQGDGRFPRNFSSFWDHESFQNGPSFRGVSCEPPWQNPWSRNLSYDNSLPFHKVYPDDGSKASNSCWKTLRHNHSRLSCGHHYSCYSVPPVSCVQYLPTVLQRGFFVMFSFL